MNASIINLLLDGPTEFSWTGIEAGTLVVILGGLFLAFVQRRWNKEDEAEKAEKAEYKATLNQFGHTLAAEREERNRDILNEAIARTTAVNNEATSRATAINDLREAARNWIAELGRDVSAIREEISFQRGTQHKDKPLFGRRSGGNQGTEG